MSQDLTPENNPIPIQPTEAPVSAQEATPTEVPLDTQLETPVEPVAPAIVPIETPEQVQEEVEKKTVGSKTRKVLAIVFIILVLLLCGVGYFVAKQMSPTGFLPTASQGDISWIRSIYGFGNKYGELTSPSGTAIDPANGTFWMTDPAFNRLVNYRIDGTLVGLVGKKVDEEGAFRLPSDLAIDNDGLIYVVEPTYDVVRVFDKQGNEQGSFTVPKPLSIAVNDNLIVVGANSGFVIMDKNANIIKVIGQEGKGENDFDKINGVAIDDEDNIYISDTFNNRLSKWTAKGDLVWRVVTGYPGNQQQTGEKTFKSDAPAQLQLPMGATIDAAGHLVIIDMFDMSIAQFDTKDGKFIKKYGNFGIEDGKFFYPTDIDYDPATDVFVIADTGVKRAQIIKVPNSGGGPLASARSFLTGPLALCCIPILILLIALVIAYLMQRSRKKKEQERYMQYALMLSEQEESAV